MPEPHTDQWAIVSGGLLGLTLAGGLHVPGAV